jgi:hypothetical protein
LYVSIRRRIFVKKMTQVDWILVFKNQYHQISSTDSQNIEGLLKFSTLISSL